MKTIAQQLNITEFPFEIKDSKGNQIYLEDSDYWNKSEYDSNNKLIYHEISNGYWFIQKYNSEGKRIYHEDSKGYREKIKYDSKGNQIYFEDSDGYWEKQEYDSNGKLIYHEDSDGKIIDNRHKTVELTLDEIAKKFNVDVKD
jgi:YD repeat-containing protein